tara:strand:+ start:335 stop:1096 length:762 start_codon:yes stop_codon:yes gene_type:complete
MAEVTSRQTLVEHCLRRLGEPVIEINVDDDQIDDKVDDAIQYFREYHTDASYKYYFKHLMTADEVDNGYIDLGSNNILSITRMLPITSSYAASRSFFNVKYQLMLNDMASMNTFIGDLGYYNQMQQYLSLLDDMLGGQPQLSWDRLTNRLYLFGDTTDGDIKAGDYIILEVYMIQDPQFTGGRFWNNMFMKDYTTQLIKQQWGQNLMKFENMQLPGGVMLNGRQFYEDATAAIEQLRENMRSEFELPADFFVG